MGDLKWCTGRLLSTPSGLFYFRQSAVGSRPDLPPFGLWRLANYDSRDFERHFRCFRTCPLGMLDGERWLGGDMGGFQGGCGLVPC